MEVAGAISKKKEEEIKHQKIGQPRFTVTVEDVISRIQSMELADLRFAVSRGSDKYHFYTDMGRFMAISPAARKLYDQSPSVSKSRMFVIAIDDISPYAILCLIGHSLNMRVRMGDCASTIDVLNASKRFGVVEMMKLCESRLMSLMSLRNVCYILQAAMHVNLPTLRERCLRICADGAFVVFGTRGFLSLKIKEVEAILQTSEVNVDNDLQLGYFLWSWCIVDCCRRGLKLSLENLSACFRPLSRFVDGPSFKRDFIKTYQLPLDEKCDSSLSLCLFKMALAKVSYKKKSATVLSANDHLCWSHRVLLPLPLPEIFYRKLEYFATSDVSDDQKIVDFEFRVSKLCYIISFSVMHRMAHEEEQKKYLAKIVFSGCYMPSYVWNDENESFFQVISTERRSASLDDYQEVIETKFEATRLLCLHEGVKYRCTVVPASKRTTFPIVWEDANSKCGHSLNVEIVSPTIHGLSEITLLEK